MSDDASLIGLDHVVIAVADLPRAIDDYRALGFTVEPGGRHPGRTSHNALVVFDDGAYFELIAWTAPAGNERWWQTLQRAGEGFVDHALLPSGTPAVLQAARARGLHTLTGPVDGGRLRPDGERLQWQSARHATPDLPFLCGDVTPRALRVPEGALRRHANGARGVASVTLAVQDLQASVARWQALLGPQALPAADPPSSDGLARAAFVLGGTRFELVSPGASTPPSHALAQRLASRGEGPWRVQLRAAEGAAPCTLDAALTHGADLLLGGG